MLQGIKKPTTQEARPAAGKYLTSLSVFRKTLAQNQHRYTTTTQHRGSRATYKKMANA